MTNLFLSSICLSSLVLRTLLTLSNKSRLTPCFSEFLVCTTLDWLWHIAFADLLDLALDVDDWQSVLGACDELLSTRYILLAGIFFLVLAELAGEEDQAGTVSLEAGDVHGEGLDGEILSAGVNGDTDSGSELAGDTSFLQFSKGETTAGPDTSVVFDGWASDDWSQLVNWARSNSCGL